MTRPYIKKKLVRKTHVTKLDGRDLDRIASLLNEGYRARDLAERLGVTDRTLYRALKRAGWRHRHVVVWAKIKSPSKQPTPPIVEVQP